MCIHQLECNIYTEDEYLACYLDHNYINTWGMYCAMFLSTYKYL